MEWRQWPCAQSSRHVGAQWCAWAERGPSRSLFAQRDFSGNSAACVHMGGAVFHEGGTRVWVPPVGLRRTLGRVARSTEHGEVADVERCASGCERHDVIGGQVAGRVGVAPVARAPVAVLTAPSPQHSRTQALPGPRAVEGVVAATVGLPCVLGAAATRAAGDDTTDRAQLHGSAPSGARTAHRAASRLTARTYPVGDPGVGVDRTSAPSWPKGVGGGRRFLVGRLGHVIALAAVGTLREKVPVAPDEQVEG